MKRLFLLAPAGAFALLFFLLWAGLARDPSRLPSTLIGKPLPAFDLADVRPAGPGLASANFRGEPRLLNVFASWCVSCRLEHPLLLALKARGVPLEGLDWKDVPAAGARYLADNGDPFERVGADPGGRTGIDLGVAGVPETFVVDGRGAVRYKAVGPITPEEWNGVIQPLMERLRSTS